ncbi:bis(5'-nucleosyl)-tetraphosphatase PrpE [Cytobacillus sp. S13-E01]|uniref:bis(5'-nucleosyl)-tetraphosphatase PrpE n=1 Tax=Cytobacillus sp. S13-E01 TaxID=3031326 RepID=UPI0023D7B7E8|nr:bis(5'-nucleosyl)-tetraphosphatase PrpE [Cytobacillus sp. S13-E01]MDF0727939.1 bis(5'-nucleosyl)-tetraphosphatase PrpE [Cytobacillus sp. S13-E01]
MNLDIIGDIHGCYDELLELLDRLGYVWNDSIPVHPNGRKLAFVGDLPDRGPKSLEVINLVYELVVKHHDAYYVPGNHCNKFYRFLKGSKVQITHGLETTAAEYEALSTREQKKVRNKFTTLYDKSPLYHQLDNGGVVIAHAGIREDYIGRDDKKVKTFVLYGDITGEKHDDGSPVRKDWAQQYNGKAWIVYGHTPVKEPRIINNTINIDTGAVFGNNLTALRYPEMETVSVPATSMPFVPEKFRSFE